MAASGSLGERVLVEERGIATVLISQRPPTESATELPPFPASELTQPKSYAVTIRSEYGRTWHEAMAREFAGLREEEALRPE